MAFRVRGNGKKVKWMVKKQGKERRIGKEESHAFFHGKFQNSV
jgi:hypothetical protein